MKLTPCCYFKMYLFLVQNTTCDKLVWARKLIKVCPKRRQRFKNCTLLKQNKNQNDSPGLTINKQDDNFLSVVVLALKNTWIFWRYMLVYKMMHFLRLTGSGGSKAARIASSKTFFKPFCVKAEHSTYFTAFNSLANFSPKNKLYIFVYLFWISKKK